MALRVNSNIAALNALRHLNKTEGDVSRNLERLSSGRRINRAADGPAALVISEQMKSQITSLSQAILNSETSISMVQTTEGALNEVSNILINLRQLAVHAANEGTNDIRMLQADQGEVENLLDTLKNIARNTQFGTRTLLDGSNSVTGVAVGDGLNFHSATEKTSSSPSEGFKVNITQAATRPMLVATRALDLEDVFSSDPNYQFSLVINEGGRTVALDAQKDPNIAPQIKKLTDVALKEDTPESKASAVLAIQQLMAAELQRKVDDANMDLEVFLYRPADRYGDFISSFDKLDDVLKELEKYPGELKDMVGDEEVLVIRHRKYGSEPHFTVSSSIDNFFNEDAPANKAVFALPGKDVEGTIGGTPELGGGQAAMGNGQVLSAAPGTDAEGLSVSYTRDTDDIIYEIFNRADNEVSGLLLREKDNDALVGEDIDGYVHLTQNSLAFQIGPNQGQQRKVSVSSVNPELLANDVKNEKGEDNVSGFRSLDEINLLDPQSAQDSLLLVDAAIDDISSLRGKLGSFQKNALEANLNNLRVSKENLVSSESNLADADMAEEMSSLVKNQILLQSGTAMLAQANQMPQTVLQLLNSMK